jgi:5-deoxy-glucuronate isomerase
MNDTDRFVLRAAERAPGEALVVTPERAGWGYSGLEVRTLDAGDAVTWRLDRDEAVLVPLSGAVTLRVTGADGPAEIALAGRTSPFAGPTDAAYLPLGATVTATSVGSTGGARVALATARATRALPAQVLSADAAPVDLRGAGVCSRRVTGYTIDTSLTVERLLVCEVVTPGGNWSSYPPHKHDEQTDDERALEEIYYFEVAPGPSGPGVAYHRTYGTAERPIDVLAEVRTGDVALVPHGYHGPCVAAPGHDLYYLNVMAGPAADGRWLAVDDPALAWVRASWADQEIDARLQPGGTRAGSPAPGVDGDAREDRS